MNILITGIHGFVGTNLVKALSAEYTIYGLDIVFPEKEGVVRTFTWDELDGDSIPQTDAVIHLAGKAHETDDRAESEDYIAVNTGLTQKIFDWFLKRQDVRKFIFFSTVKAVADHVDGILTEDVEPSPKGPYGESKLLAEQYILANMPADGSGKSVYIFRPCMIHGPGNKGNLNLLYSFASKGLPWPLGSYDNRRTFTSIENVTFVLGRFLTQKPPSGIYNLCDDEAVSTNELIEIICKVEHKKPRIWKISPSFMNRVAVIGEKYHLPLTPVRMRKLTENYISSNDKLKKVLGIDKLPVAARDGLESTIKSFFGER